MTPHIEAKKDDIAKTVLMPGDPLRAKMIAETYLDNYKLVNKVRGMLGYTGFYKGKKVTVMGSGMGMPSMGIYSYELFKLYDVDNIIRIGSAGSYTLELSLYDIVLANDAYSESSYALVQNNYSKNIIEASKNLNNQLIKTADKLGKKIKIGRIHSSDVFYQENNKYEELFENQQCVAVEMEAFALFHNARVTGKSAACILTISDSLVTKKETTSEERQNSFTEMVEIALESI